MDYAEAAPVLNLIGMLEASRRPLDPSQAALELDLPKATLVDRVRSLEGLGLVLTAPDENLHPLLLNAGRQYLAMGGNVDGATLRFLPTTLDDLHARRALLHAGVLLVDEFRTAVLEGRGVEHAQSIVPAAFVEAVTERVAIDLFAAAVALVTRLSDDQPAGCVAEEILAVTLLEHARSWLEMEVDEAVLDERSGSAASAELSSLFELFQDDDVLQMFEMEEPADGSSCSLPG